MVILVGRVLMRMEDLAFGAWTSRLLSGIRDSKILGMQSSLYGGCHSRIISRYRDFWCFYKQ